MRVFRSYIFCLVALGVTFAGFVYALCDLYHGTWTWGNVGIFGGAFALIATGITVGYHRYLTHRSFEFTTVGAWIAKPFLLWAGCIAWQGSPLWWAAVHTEHHADADGEHDPHTPVARRSGFWRRVGQFLWAHILWIPYARPDIERFCRLRGIRGMDRFFEQWYLLVGPVAGAVVFFWIGGLAGLAWYLAAVSVAWHLTSAINSVTHLGDLLGYGRFQTRDNSTNVWWLSLLTFGEALHRNHHAFPTSARFAHLWWERCLDFGYLELLLLRACGLVRNLRIPSNTQLAGKLVPSS